MLSWIRAIVSQGLYYVQKVIFFGLFVVWAFVRLRLEVKSLDEEASKDISESNDSLDDFGRIDDNERAQARIH